MREIQLKDIGVYEEFIKMTEYPANLWSANFAYLWSRNQSPLEKILWKIVDGMLVTFIYTTKGYLQLPCLPFGPGESRKVIDVLYKCMSYCYEVNRHKACKTMLRVINDSQLDFLRLSKKFTKFFKVKKLQGEDRHIGIQKLINLQGKEFANVRNSINKFHRTFPHAIIRPYRQSDYRALIKLKEHWNGTVGRKYRRIHDDNYYRLIIRNYKELDHSILIVEVEGEIVGMVSGGALPNGESWGCLSKKRIDMMGLSEVLYVEFAREINKINPAVELMNLGIDIGANNGLKRFKDKFRPVYNAKRYRIFLK